MGNIYQGTGEVLSNTKPCVLVNLQGQDINGVQVLPASAVLASSLQIFAVNQNGDALK